jgi:hypothetical protein
MFLFASLPRYTGAQTLANGHPADPDEPALPFEGHSTCVRAIVPAPIWAHARQRGWAANGEQTVHETSDWLSVTAGTGAVGWNMTNRAWSHYAECRLEPQPLDPWGALRTDPAGALVLSP